MAESEWGLGPCRIRVRFGKYSFLLIRCDRTNYSEYLVFRDGVIKSSTWSLVRQENFREENVIYVFVCFYSILITG